MKTLSRSSSVAETGGVRTVNKQHSRELEALQQQMDEDFELAPGESELCAHSLSGIQLSSFMGLQCNHGLMM